jgi:hypothetical protein
VEGSENVKGEGEGRREMGMMGRGSDRRREVLRRNEIGRERG